MITDVDFLIHTNSNPEGLEALVLSIAERYSGANITICDSSRALDRTVYKDISIKAAKAGLTSRIKALHVGHNASISYIWNNIFAQTPRKYKLTLSDSMLFTDDTDINAMVAVMEKETNAAVVNGADNEGEQGVALAGHVSTFALVLKDIFHKHAWQGVDPYEDLYKYLSERTTWHVYTCAAAVISSSIIENEAAQEPTGGQSNSGGTPTQPDVQGANDGGGKQGAGTDMLPSGENEAAKNTNTSGRQRASNSRPLQGQGNK